MDPRRRRLIARLLDARSIEDLAALAGQRPEVLTLEFEREIVELIQRALGQGERERATALAHLAVALEALREPEPAEAGLLDLLMCTASVGSQRQPMRSRGR